MEIYNYCIESPKRLNAKRYVAKFVGRRLDTPEKVYNMYCDWNEPEDIMHDIMSILWVMDNQIVSMASCINYFDEKENANNGLNENTNNGLQILKKIWDLWIGKDTSLNYSKLHTELIPIIRKDKLSEIRELFTDTKLITVKIQSVQIVQ